MWNLKPSFLRIFVNSLPIPASIVGKMLGANSTTSTLAPKRAYTEPSSRPMTPPPMTNIFLGISLRLRASVEVMMRFLSGSMPGK